MSGRRFVAVAIAIAAASPGHAQSPAAFTSTPRGPGLGPDTQLIVAHPPAENRDVSTHYDRFRNLTTVAVKPFDPGGGLDLRIEASFIGRQPNETPATVRFVFTSTSFGWIYGDDWALRLALPDASMLHYAGERLWKVASESHFDARTSTIAIEVLTFDIPLADVHHLIQAGSAIGMLGPTQIELTRRRVAAIANFVSRITPRR